MLQLPKRRRSRTLQSRRHAETFRRRSFQFESGRDQRHGRNRQWVPHNPAYRMISQLNYLKPKFKHLLLLLRRMHNCIMSNQPFEAGEDEEHRISVDFESSIITVRPQQLNIQNGRQKLVFLEDDDANIQDILQRCVNSARNAPQAQGENGSNRNRVRQPLRLKFKGIIINKVIGEIYRSRQRNLCLESFGKLMLNMTQRSEQTRLALIDLQSRTKEAIVCTLQYILNLQRLKQLKSALASLTQS